MGTEIFLIGVGLLVIIAVLDIMVGVSNDAVNFLNSSIGSGVASRATIMVIASFGIMAGVTFSGGMMEVARKGIFHPQFFTMPELLTIFLAVMIADILLLDLFNTYGLPTSTTVSIIFELLGAAVAVSLLKILAAGDSLMTFVQYINTAKAMMIIMGILMSVVIAFFCGALVQFLTRILFTFNYKQKLNRYGALWGGVALTSITYFILVKGAKGASFITAENVIWIKSHTTLILLVIFIVSAILLQILLVFKVNILKPIVLIGTFALAMAFAANDLVNFIGVPLAGIHSYKAAIAAGDPLTITMGALSKKVQSETIFLLIAGLIMVVTLWFSKKARTVTETEISLGQQEEGHERFESIFLSRAIVRLILHFSELLRHIIPRRIRILINRRTDPRSFRSVPDGERKPSFDLLRASVNLMVASAVVSYATANKLPLSTTYVTFMVAMGSSFADQAWGRESAVYRVTGVLTVIGGWFMTAVMAFSFAGVFAAIIFYGKGFGVIALLGLAAVLIWHAHRKHQAISLETKKQKIFNLENIETPQKGVETSFGHMSLLLEEIRKSLDNTLDALFLQDFDRLTVERKKLKQTQKWSNIISANILKAMRLLQQSGLSISHQYPQTVRRLQKLTNGHRDIVLRAYTHVGNQHKGLLRVQIEELQQVRQMLNDILLEVERTFTQKKTANVQNLTEKHRQIRDLADDLNALQRERIMDNSSKTRLSILYYAIVGDAIMLSKQNLKLLEIFNESFGKLEKRAQAETK
jgi:phosphate/sulfate permease